MKRSLKVAAAGLSAVMLVPMITGCYKTSSDADVISEDDPWYNLEMITIDPGIDKTEYEYVGNRFIAEMGDYYVYMMEGIKLLPADFDYNTDDYMDYVVQDIDVYDLQGNLVSVVSVSDYLAECDLGEYVVVNDVTKVGEELRVDILSYNMTTGAQTNYRTLFDFDTLTFGEPEPVEEFEYTERLADEDASEESSHIIGEYTIRKFWVSGDAPSYVLEVIDADDNVTEFDFRDLFPTQPVFDIPSIVDLGNDKALICANYNGEDLFYLLDFAAMEVTNVTDNMSWFNCDSDNIYQVDGMGAVVMDRLGLSTINYDAQTVEPSFQYSYSNVNVNDITMFTPISVSEDRAVFTGDVTPPDAAYGDSTTMIYIFTKADTNPNVGKTILELAVIDDYSPALCSAVCLFNESNENYFIRYNDSYMIENEVDNTNSDNEDDGSLAIDQASANLGNRLTVDLMSGEGPDLIVNGATFGMLNDDDYLLDLSSFISENCGADSYYTNIFDAARTEEALYQLPLSFSIQGIATSPDNVEDGQVGLTFEQYQALVEGPCNGTSPIQGGRLSLFIEALNCMQDLVIADGQVNYDCDAFRALAEYVNEYITEDLTLNDDDYYSDMGFDTSDEGARMAYINDVIGYYDAVASNDYVLLGIPSYDGRGPIIFGTDSIAVSANSASEEGCLEFLSLLLDEQVQEYYGMNGGLPVNRAAFTSVGHKFIEQRQAEIEQLLRFYDEDLLRMYGYSTDAMSDDNLAELEQIILGLSGWYSNDGAINAIIREEMPAYFEGQKTLDQVIPVLEDRVQTVLNERLG